jgi:hypothetical protein
MSPKLNSSSKIYNGLSPKISQAKALARFSPFCYAAQYYVGMFTVAYDYMSGSSNSRRQFIVHAGVWFAGAALARPFSALAATNSNLPESLSGRCCPIMEAACRFSADRLSDS